MEENKKTVQKKKIIPVRFIAMLAVLAATVLFGACGDKGYRLIQVYELDGTAEIERENTGKIDAYESLRLLSKDLMSVEEESYVRLRMDEDKYMLVEPGSVLSIYATGNQENSKTDIDLQAGAVTVEIQNKLSDGSSYQITTPNSVMAVRGTVFHVKVEVDKDGYPVTNVKLFEGKVTAQKKNEDGTISKEQEVGSGNTVIICREQEDVVIKIQEEIDYTELPVKTLETLESISSEGRELCITTEEIKEKVETAKVQEAAAKEAEAETEEGTESGEPVAEEETESETASENEEETVEPVKQKKPVVEEEPESETETKTETPPPVVSEPPPAPEPAPVYTVTFQYNGSVFGTQQVTKGEMAQQPMFLPAESGNWDFDFATPIQQDTVIEFKAN